MLEAVPSEPPSLARASLGERQWRQGRRHPLGEPERACVRALHVCHATAPWFDHRNGQLLCHMQSRITASFRATATRAFLIPCRAAMCRPHRLSVDHPPFRPSNVVAASYNARSCPEVAGLCHMTGSIGFAGLIAARRQAKPWSNRLYFCEPSRVVHRVTEGERYDSADAWRRH